MLKLYYCKICTESRPDKAVARAERRALPPRNALRGFGARKPQRPGTLFILDFAYFVRFVVYFVHCTVFGYRFMVCLVRFIVLCTV